MNEYLVAFLIQLVVGFVYSAIMAGNFEQDEKSKIFLNFVFWEAVIIFSISLMLWRLISGDRPSHYEKKHYIWSWWE